MADLPFAVFIPSKAAFSVQAMSPAGSLDDVEGP
jgi:hypothetical protein